LTVVVTRLAIGGLKKRTSRTKKIVKRLENTQILLRSPRAANLMSTENPQQTMTTIRRATPVTITK